MLVNMGWDNLVVHDCELVTALITLFKKFQVTQYYHRNIYLCLGT